MSNFTCLVSLTAVMTNEMPENATASAYIHKLRSLYSDYLKIRFIHSFVHTFIIHLLLFTHGNYEVRTVLVGKYNLKKYWMNCWTSVTHAYVRCLILTLLTGTIVRRPWEPMQTFANFSKEINASIHYQHVIITREVVEYLNTLIPSSYLEICYELVCQLLLFGLLSPHR
jgi:hypothetical protein